MVAKPSPLYSTLSLALIDFIKAKGKAHEKMLSEREITKSIMSVAPPFEQR